MDETGNDFIGRDFKTKNEERVRTRNTWRTLIMLEAANLKLCFGRQAEYLRVPNSEAGPWWSYGRYIWKDYHCRSDFYMLQPFSPSLLSICMAFSSCIRATPCATFAFYCVQTIGVLLIQTKNLNRTKDWSQITLQVVWVKTCYNWYNNRDGRKW